MTTIEDIKNECQGWTGLRSDNPQGQFAQRAAKSLLVTIEHIEREEGKGRMDADDAQDKLNELCAIWEESK